MVIHINDKDVTKLEIVDMVNTAGWKFIDSWLCEQIASANIRLLTVNPEEKGKVYEYQSLIKNYNRLIAYIDTLQK